MNRSKSMCGILESFEGFTVEENQNFLLYLLAVGAEIVPNVITGDRVVYFDADNGIHGGKVLYLYSSRFTVLTNISGYSIELPKNTQLELYTTSIESTDGTTLLHEINDTNYFYFVPMMTESNVFARAKRDVRISERYNGTVE